MYAFKKKILVRVYNNEFFLCFLLTQLGGGGGGGAPRLNDVVVDDDFRLGGRVGGFSTTFLLSEVRFFWFFND